MGKYTEAELTAIREKISLVELVTQYTERVFRSGSQYKAQCPFHSDSNPSMSVDDDNGLYNCFGCGAKGNIFNFIMEIEKLDFPSAVKHLKDIAEKSPNVDAKKREGRKVRQVFKKFSEPKEIPTYRWERIHENILENSEIQNAFLDRGIKLSTITAHMIGFVKSGRDLGLRPEGEFEETADVPWVGFPYIYGDSVRLVKWRTLLPHKKGYMRPRGMADCLYIFGEPDEFDDVIVVEGEIDALSLWQAGFRAVSVSSGARSRIDDEVVEYLTGFRKVYLALDNDEKGLACAHRFVTALPKEMVKVITIPAEYKDANGLHVKGCDGDTEVFREKMQALIDASDRPEAASFMNLEQAFDAFLKSIGEGRGPDEERWFEMPWRAADRMAVIKPGQIVSLVSSKSGMGKTTLALQIALHNALHRRRRVAYYTAEMETVDEMVPMVTAQLTRHGRDDLDQMDVEDAKRMCTGTDFYFGYDPDANGWRDVAKIILAAIKQLGLEVIFIDHLDFIIRYADQRTQDAEKALAMQWFVKVSKKYGVTFFILRQPVKPSQQDRRRGNKPADVYDIQGSASAVTDSNHVFVLHRNKVTTLEEGDGKDIFEAESILILGKSRRKGKGSSVVRLVLNGPCARFERPSRDVVEETPDKDGTVPFDEEDKGGDEKLPYKDN